MGKVLHASYSGYFPWCESDVSLEPYDLSGDLTQIMYAWWRVKSWNYSYSYSDGAGNSRSGEVQLFQFGFFAQNFQQITDEAQLVCYNGGISLAPGYGQGIPNLGDDDGSLSMGGSHKIYSSSNSQIAFYFDLEGDDEFWNGAQFDPNPPGRQEIGSMYISFPGHSLTKPIYSFTSGEESNNSCIVSLTANSFWDYD